MEFAKYRIKYEVQQSYKFLKILSKDFVKTNRNKGKLIINNKKYCLKEYNELNNFDEYELKINILFNKDISNLSCMFKNCYSLLEFSMNNNKGNKEVMYGYNDLEIEDNNVDFLDYIKEIDLDKGTVLEGTKGDIDNGYSEISKKDESSDEIDNNYLEITNTKKIMILLQK